MRHIEAQQIENLFAGNIRQLLMDAELNYDKLYEIRLRVGRPLFLTYDGGECFLRKPGQEQYLVTREDLKETLEYVTGYSLYAYEDEIRQGFISVQGGHRVGVTGKVVLDRGRIMGMKYISCINVRLAHEVVGCADQVMPYIRKKDWVAHTLIVSPPRGGKTTLLRDMIRKISDEGQTVGVVDERSEIGACYQGVAQNDLGIQTDVMDACEKGQGMNMLIRSMAPDVIAVDEIGSKEDVEALFFCAYRGCSILATAHGKNKESLSKNPYMREIINKKMFQRYVILEQRNQPGYIAQIMDENGVILN